MTLLLILIVIILFLGGGYYGPRYTGIGPQGSYVIWILGIIIVIYLVLHLTGVGFD